MLRERVMRKTAFFLTIIIMMIFQCGCPAFAALTTVVEIEEDDSSGFLVMESASVRNGDPDIPVNPVIQLNFNKNVVSISVMFDNVNCFHLTDADGVVVPIRVIFPDDQLQTTFRNNIFITPQEPLKPNSVYSLMIDNTLKARNGDMMADARVLTFSTSGSATDEINPILARLGDEIMSFETALEPTGASFPSAVPATGPVSSDGPSKRGIDVSVLAVLITAAACLLLIAVVLISYKHKKKRSVQEH